MSKTKAELMNEIENLKAQIKINEKQELYDKAAHELRQAYDAMMNVGFSEEQAWEFIIKNIKNN